MAEYTPTPIDISDILLPRDLNGLMEQLARNSHDIWASHRQAEGWEYGPQRDDLKKQSPCLVPYEQLPESEKDYDRESSKSTLKSIYKLGFSITKKAIGKILIVGSYLPEDIDRFKQEALKQNLEIEFFDDWDSARNVLERNLLNWSAIILDTYAKVQEDEAPSCFFLRDALSDLTAIFSRNRNEIPWYISPNVTDAHTEELVKYTVSRERGKKGWGPTLFEKKDIHNLFINISETLPNTRNYRIRCVYDDVFECLDKLFSPKAKELLFNILLPLHYPEVYHSFTPSDYYNGLRRVLESFFEVCYQYGLIPAEICYNNGKRAINLRYSCDYLIYGEIKDYNSKLGTGICSFSIASMLDNLLNITNEGSHMGDSLKIEGRYYSIMGLSLQLCDIIVWLGNYIESQNCTSIFEKMNQFVGQEISVSWDDELLCYYFDKCELPKNAYIEKAYHNKKPIRIGSVKANGSSNKKRYPFFAKYQII